MQYLLINRFWYFVIILTFLLILNTGCDLFEVDNQNSLEADKLNDPQNIPVLKNSAEGAVSNEYSQAVYVGETPGDGIIVVSTEQSGSNFIDDGLFEDHYAFSGNLWNDLAAATWTTTDVRKRLEELVENPESDISVARSYFWEAIARITQADLFKEIPFDGGPPQTPAEVYERSIKSLNKSLEISQATTETEESIKYEAVSYASLARVYRSLYFERGGQMSAFQQAAEFARKALQVDSEFYIAMRNNPPASQNEVFTNINQSQYYKMGPNYANLRDPVSGEIDSRIEHGPPTGVNVDGDTLYRQLKYPSTAAEIPVSRWQEAELILAEYELLEDEYANAVQHINRVRNAAGLSSFTSSDPQEIKEQIIYERKAEFFLELRRWQDMRYYNIIPDDWIPRAKQMGVDRRFPVSQDERLGNPNY